jgi:hypothetical protein
MLQTTPRCPRPDPRTPRCAVHTLTPQVLFGLRSARGNCCGSVNVAEYLATNSLIRLTIRWGPRRVTTSACSVPTIALRRVRYRRPSISHTASRGPEVPLEAVQSGASRPNPYSAGARSSTAPPSPSPAQPRWYSPTTAAGAFASGQSPRSPPAPLMPLCK